jgi:hypothetical protein
MNAKMYNAVVNVGDISKGNKGYITYHKINSLEKFKLFLGGNHPQWIFMRVYDHKTKEEIGLIKKQ